MKLSGVQVKSHRLPPLSEKGACHVVQHFLVKAQFGEKYLHPSVLWGISVILVGLSCPSLHWNALKPHSHVGSTVLIHRNGHRELHSSTH